LPEDPLVCKSVLFFISDIGVKFRLIPEAFPLALKYVMTAGFYNPHRANFFLDSNAIECLLNFSSDCRELFDTDAVFSTIDIACAALPELKSNYADKLIQALLKLVSLLPAEAFAQKLQAILKYATDQAAVLCPSQTDSHETKKQVGKIILIWAAVLKSLSSVDIQASIGILAAPISAAVTLGSSALGAYSQDEGVVMAVSNLYKSLVQALKTEAVRSR
jgi:hypothetical protein